MAYASAGPGRVIPLAIILILVVGVFFLSQKMKKAKVTSSDTQQKFIQERMITLKQPDAFKLPTEHFETLDLFPVTYKNKVIDSQRAYVISEQEWFDGKNERDPNCVRSQYDQKIIDTEKGFYDKITASDRKYRKVASRAKRGAIIGFIIGCWVGLMAIIGLGPIGILVWVALIAGGALIGKSIDKSLLRKTEELRQQKEQAVDAIKKNCEEAKQASLVRCEQSKGLAAESIKEYTDKFTEAAMKKSIEFAANPLVSKISSWFVETCAIPVITGLDRSNNVELIVSAMKLTVYIDRVSFEDSDEVLFFDFSGNRIANLDTPILRAAVALALEAEIQADLMEKIPEDICGSAAVVEIADSDIGENTFNPNIVFSYTASNENFKPVQKW